MKTLYLLACCLFLAAIAADLRGKCCYSAGLRTRARAMGSSDTDQESARAEADADFMVGNHLTTLGLVTAAIGVVTWLTSVVLGKRQGKRPTLVIPLVLLAAYILIFLVMV